MSENTENVKKIRELEDFDTAVPLSDQDYLIVATNEDANNDGTKERVPLTKKAKISEAINAVNKAEAERRESEPDTVTLPDGTEIANPLKGATSELDENGVLVDTTPVTAENLDSLVDPGSGLEVKTICSNEDFEVVDCDDPSVKYRTKKLGVAVSNESKTIRMHINNDTGQEYSAGLGIIVADDGKSEVSVKFKRLRDAYSFIRNDIGDSDSIVNIYVETDIDEGTVTNTNGTYISRGDTETNGCYVYIYGSDAVWRNSGNPPKIKIKSNSTPDTISYVPMWFTSYRTRINFIHFCFDLDDNLGIHAAIRSYKNSVLEFFGCKFTVRGGAHSFIEASRGGVVEIQNKSDDLALLDNRSKGFWEPAVEFDFKPRGSNATSGTSKTGDPFICSYLFAGDTGGVFRFPEYGVALPYGGNRKTNFQSRIHFCSDEIRTIQSLFGVENNCSIDIIACFTTNPGLDFVSTIQDSEGNTVTKIPYFLTASAFNAVGIRHSYQPGGTVVAVSNPLDFYGEMFDNGGVVPGEEFVNNTTQFGVAVKEDVDYVRRSEINSSNTLIDRVKMMPDSETETELGTYWEGHTF